MAKKDKEEVQDQQPEAAKQEEKAAEAKLAAGEAKAEAAEATKAKEPKAPKLTVGRQVHFYFAVPGDPHAATVAAVKEDGLTLAVLCPHDERLVFKKGVQYSDVPQARHYTMPPKA